jgi:ParB family chromosome partitioning protein
VSKRGLPTGLQMRHDSHYVEDLAGNHPAAIGRLISIDLLDPNPEQPRVEIGDLDELVASIKEKGVLEPLLVKPCPLTGRWMIIAGERRWRASKAAGLRSVPCIEMDVDDRAVAEIALIENMQRKDLTPWEEADGLAALCGKFGYTHDDVAKILGKSRTTVTESLSIASLPEVIREECRRADITAKSTLLELVRQPDDITMRQALRDITKRKLNREDLRQARRTRRVEIEKTEKTGESKPFVFNSKPPDDAFRVEIVFKDGVVGETRVRGALLAALASLAGNE